MIEEIVKIMADSHDHLYEGALDILLYLQKNGKLGMTEKEVRLLAPKWLLRTNDGCVGFVNSNCCDARIVDNTDICSMCGEHCETMCADCEDVCEDYRVMGSI